MGLSPKKNGCSDTSGRGLVSCLCLYERKRRGDVVREVAGGGRVRVVKGLMGELGEKEDDASLGNGFFLPRTGGRHRSTTLTFLNHTAPPQT